MNAETADYLARPCAALAPLRCFTAKHGNGEPIRDIVRSSNVSRSAISPLNA
jgi:hypothetical protein